MNRRQRKQARRLAAGGPAPLVVQLQALGACPDYGPDVHTVEAAAAVARDRVAWQQARERIMEQHRKRMRVGDPELLQEIHSPTVELSVDDPEDMRKLRRNVTRVRQSDAWRYNVLTAMQRQAETEMSTAWKARTVGLDITASNMTKIAQGAFFGHAASDHGESQWLAELDATWRSLVAECRRERIPFGLVVRVLVEPLTLGQIERAHRLAAGAALFEYCRALDLWAWLRGWTRSTAR